MCSMKSVYVDWTNHANDGSLSPYNTYITQYPKTAVLLKILYKHVIEIHVLMNNT